MALSNAYLVDPNPEEAVRLSALINFSDGTGDAPSGVVPAIAADPDDFFTNGETSPTEADYAMDNLIALGIKRVTFNRPFGDWDAAGALANCPGHYPFNYPDATAGGTLSVTPRNQVQSEAAFGGTSYTDALKAAFDTVARSGSLYGAAAYLSPVAAVAAIDDTTLDSYSKFIRDLNLDSIYDVMSVISHTGTAPPYFMGSNLLGYWEADQAAYQSSGSGTPATANGNVIDHWNSLSGSAVWTQTTNANRPTIKLPGINGKPSVLFNGTSNRFTLGTPLSPGAAFTITMVVKPTANDTILMSAAAAVTNRQVRFNEGAAGRISIFDGTNVTVAANSSFTAGAWSIVRFRHTGTICRIFVNGTETSYFGANNAESNMILSMLGAFGNGGASTFFDGELAALAIMNANCTDNQIQLIEKYWAGKYALSVAGSPTLPHVAYINRLFTGYGRKAYREDFNYRTITELTDWDTNGGGILTVYSHLASSLASAATKYTKDSIGTGQRARVMILNDGQTPAVRTARMLEVAALGYDVDLDFGGFTTAQITNAINQFVSATAGVSNIGLWPQLARLRGSQRWPVPPR